MTIYTAALQVIENTETDSKYDECTHFLPALELAVVVVGLPVRAADRLVDVLARAAPREIDVGVTEAEAVLGDDVGSVGSGQES